MNLAIWAAAAYGGTATLVHLASIAIAIKRCRAPRRPVVTPANAPAISVVRPVCGLDNYVEATLRSTFHLDYPDYEVIFCAATTKDPVVPLVRSLMAEHPRVTARLLIGDERISANPKLNNCFKGWRAAAHDWIVLADSNLFMPRDYLARLVTCWRPDTGVVSAPPVGGHPVGFWAALECAFLNTFQVRWQYVADSLGLGFAQGKTLFYRRDMIEAAGGLRALGAEAAEDAATTKIVRAAGLRVRLVDAPFEQPLGHRGRKDVWDRQVRWARLRRASFGAYFMLEIGAGAALPIAALVFVAAGTDAPIAAVSATVAALWYGAEMLLAAAAGWHLPLLYPVHAALRDLLLPVLWIKGFSASGFVWRGNQMSAAESGDAETA